MAKFEFEAEDIGKISDGYHTFDELYYHRMILFSVICDTYKEKSFKSWKHHDGTMYEGYFIVGIFTPEGTYTYHYPEIFWNFFDVTVFETAPEWDGHKPGDVTRLRSLLGEEKLVNKSVYKFLLDQSDRLSALQEHGVDNWENYGEAMSSLLEEENE